MDRAETLQRLAQLCHRGAQKTAAAAESSGWAELDQVLPGGGWQAGTIVELMPPQTGLGELRLLLPALAQITRAERHVALIAPPYIPFAPGWEQYGVRLERLLVIRAQKNVDILWSLEQILRCGSFGAALAWPGSIHDRETRRLQLAAQAGRSTGFIYRPPEAALETSPAAVRLQLRKSEADELEINLLKCRGARNGICVAINTSR